METTNTNQEDLKMKLEIINNDVIETLHNLDNVSINSYINEIYQTDDIDERMDLISQILIELDLNDISYENCEDEIKDIIW